VLASGINLSSLSLAITVSFFARKSDDLDGFFFMKFSKESAPALDCAKTWEEVIIKTKKQRKMELLFFINSF
jgi:hypothetical protein